MLFVSADVGFETTSLSTVDGFTGQVETTVTPVIGTAAQRWDVQDIAMRPDGFMFGFTVDEEDGNPQDTEAGNYLQISTGDGTIMNLDAAGNPPDDGVTTFEDDGTGASVLSGHGIHYDATVFGFPTPGALQGFVVGHRPDNAVFAPGTTPFPSQRKNILYRFLYILPCANYWRRKQALGLRTQLVVGQVPGQGAACRSQASVGPRVFRRSPQDPGPAATSLTSSAPYPLLGLSSLPCVENASTFFSRQYVEAASWKRETCENLS